MLGCFVLNSDKTEKLETVEQVPFEAFQYNSSEKGGGGPSLSWSSENTLTYSISELNPS